MDRDNTFPELSTRYPASDVHNERHRVAELQPPKGDQKSNGFPNDRYGDEALLHGHPEYLKEMEDADQVLEPGTELPGDQIRRPDTGLKEFTQKS